MLRICGCEDIGFILAIRNLPEVIRVSNRRRPLAREELPCLDDPLYRIWIVCNGEADLGYIIANLKDGDRAIISIALCENARGQGFGSSALREACSLLFKECGIMEVAAEIYKGNIASQGAFEKAGFTFRHRTCSLDGRLKDIYTWAPR